MKIDERALKAAMKKMGIQSEDIPATLVIIHSEGKDIIIKNPSVMLVKSPMTGGDSFQISGTVEEREPQPLVTEDDINTVMSQAGVSRSVAQQALGACKGDLAAAIMRLSGEGNP